MEHFHAHEDFESEIEGYLDFEEGIAEESRKKLELMSKRGYKVKKSMWNGLMAS